MPSSCRRTSAAASSASRIRSPALSWATRSAMASHSGVAYSGWEPTSRYNRAPFSRNTFEDRPQCTTRRNRYRATSLGQRRLSPDEVARYLFRRVVHWGRSSNVFLENGARLYLDVGSHPEYATPECDAIADLVAHDKA